VWFSHVAECFDPETGEKVEDDNPQTIWAKAHAAHAGLPVIVAFKVTKPDNLTWPEILTSLKGQSYVRVLVADKKESAGLAVERIRCALLADPACHGIGLSAGIARVSPDPASALALAAAKLYAAKSLRR